MEQKGKMCRGGGSRNWRKFRKKWEIFLYTSLDNFRRESPDGSSFGNGGGVAKV